MKFKNTMHALCVYHGTFNDEFVLFLRLVNNFSIGSRLEETYTKLCDMLDKNWQVPMSRYGMMKHFHDIDISIPSKKYLETVFNNYGWNDISPTSLSMNPSNDFIRALDSAEPLEPAHCSCLDSTRFRYRDAIGELIWPIIATYPELSYPVVKLSQFSTNPATVHYDAVHGIFWYLSGTRNGGLTYIRPKPLTWGSVVKHTPL
jgi:hypothetical protein